MTGMKVSDRRPSRNLEARNGSKPGTSADPCPSSNPIRRSCFVRASHSSLRHPLGRGRIVTRLAMKRSPSGSDLFGRWDSLFLIRSREEEDRRAPSQAAKQLPELSNSRSPLAVPNGSILCQPMIHEYIHGSNVNVMQNSLILPDKDYSVAVLVGFE